MKQYLLIALCFAALATAETVCGGGCKGDACDKSTGECTQSGCLENWTSSSGNKCDVPVCFGKAGCAQGGKCVAPNYCVCGTSGAQVVGVQREFDGIEGVNCVNLRAQGIKGAGVALLVLFVSITTCGLIERQRNKNK